MVLDTSALLALLLDEPEAEEFRAAVEEDTTRLVSAATLFETALVIEARKGEPGGRELDALIQKADVVVVPVDAEHVFEARRAYRRFAKGRHAARLSFGDLLAYALARTSGEPLLFKGDDFAKTDVGRVFRQP
jgi:ribonuclease VapC